MKKPKSKSGGSPKPNCCAELVRKWKARRIMWDNFNKRVHDIEVGRRAEARVCTYTRCIEGLEYALKQHNTKRSNAPSGLLTRLVSLRQYLEENLHQMEMCQQRASARGGLKRYWREGVRKMKVHLATVKALEREAPTKTP